METKFLGSTHVGAVHYVSSDQVAGMRALWIMLRVGAVRYVL